MVVVVVVVVVVEDEEAIALSREHAVFLKKVHEVDAQQVAVVATVDAAERHVRLEIFEVSEHLSLQVYLVFLVSDERKVVGSALERLSTQHFFS